MTKIIQLISILFIATVLYGCTSLSSDHQLIKATRTEKEQTKLNFSENGEMWYLKNGKLYEMEGELGYIEASIGQAFKQAFTFDFTNKFAIITHGNSAPFKIHQTQPTFYIKTKPTEAGIVKLTVQPERNRRYIWVVSQVGSNAGYFHPDSDNIAFHYAKTNKGVYKMTVDEPLSAGEYGIILPGGKAGYTVYDFSVSSQ